MIFLCVMRRLKVGSLSKFQVYNTVLLTAVTTPYISSLGLICPLFPSLCPYIASASSPLTPPLSLGTHHDTFCFHMFRFHILVVPYSISLSDLFHLAKCPPAPFMLSQMRGFPKQWFFVCM